MPNNSNLILSISKEELTELPLVQYNAGAVIIDSDAHIAEAVEQLSNAEIVGFDTETRPSFRKGQSFNVSLLQLATPTRCFLFRLNMIGLHPLLKQLLENSRILKVGLSLRDDFHSLSKIGLIRPDGFVDLQQYVKQFGIADNSLSRIYAILFGKRISKNQRLTNWEAEHLTQAQINYAAFDAISCIQIYEYLNSGQFNPMQSKYRIIPETAEK
ncbi:MAG: 3'-5' exonuclease domain-containing protein 2 [Prevotella sp.]|nr:3'-5' exonuclease domain-containing protein 2 [Prevotella sp.]MCM1074615.1 3'-5' exonuclease domain-containing protein 2 [Ruminococcus sp.]